VTLKKLQARRLEILAELADLDQMRRGSITQQVVKSSNRAGERIRRGPYPLYTYKEKGRTISRRLKNEFEVESFRKQIDNFRRFETLTRELRALGEKMCELVESSPEKKQRNLRSRKTRK